MYAHRQIYPHAQATIAVPPELQNRPIEVIFMALNEFSESSSPNMAQKQAAATNIQQVFGLVKASKHVSLEDMEQAIGYIVLSPRGRELERGLSGVDESIGICVGAAYNA